MCLNLVTLMEKIQSYFSHLLQFSLYPGHIIVIQLVTKFPAFVETNSLCLTFTSILLLF
jgi:hypothetical protein